MSDDRRGLLLGVTAYSLWGLFPLYWPLVKPATAAEILSHRVVWSLFVVALLLARGGGFAALKTLGRRRLGLLAVASLLIAVNWGSYIWGVNHGHVIEASLGYFITPLVTVLLGVFVLGERLRPWQWAALGLAALAVVVLTVDYGRPPWLAIVLALSFSAYGLIKKKAAVGAVPGLCIETAVLVAPALAYLVLLDVRGIGTFGHASWLTTALLAASGVVTAVPLLCFAAAANRIPLSTIGLLQYIAPSLQLVCGLVIAHEPMPASRWAGFAIVWAGLAVSVIDGFVARRRGARRSAAPVTA